MLAVVEFVKHFRYYLLGRKFLLRTVHGCLRWLMGFKESGEGLIGRWLARLAMYDFSVQHRMGKLHGNADALSRMEWSPKKGCGTLQCASLLEGKNSRSPGTQEEWLFGTGNDHRCRGDIQLASHVDQGGVVVPRGACQPQDGQEVDRRRSITPYTRGSHDIVWR